MPEVHIPRTYSVPASIQFKNPGAMWPGPVATKWHSVKWQYLADGTGQGGGGHGNKIAIFDNWVDGLCALIDLWRMSPKYRNKRFKEAIKTWGGGNATQSYIDDLCRQVPGLTPDTIMDDRFWAGATALTFLKAQSRHEAGKPIPATDADWAEAQRRVFIGPVQPSSNATKTGGSITAGGGVVAAANSAGLGWHWALIIGAVVAVAVFVIWKFNSKPAVAPVVLPPEAYVSPGEGVK